MMDLVSREDDASSHAMRLMTILRTDGDLFIKEIKPLIKSNPKKALAIITTEIGGWTLLHACALRGSKEVMKTILKSGVDVNIPMGQPEGLPGKCTPLHIAAYRDDYTITELLVTRGGNANLKDTTGQVPLDYATGSQNVNLVRLLSDPVSRTEMKRRRFLNRKSLRPFSCGLFGSATQS